MVIANTIMQEMMQEMNLPTTQEIILHIDIIRWSTPKSDGLYSLQSKMEFHTVSKNKTRS